MEGRVVGAIVCKMENTKGPMGRNDNIRRGYIAMLAVDNSHRRKKIGKIGFVIFACFPRIITRSRTAVDERL